MSPTQDGDEPSGQAGAWPGRRSSAAAASLTDKAQGDGQARPNGERNAPLAARGKDVFAAMALAGNPEADVPSHRGSPEAPGTPAPAGDEPAMALNGQGAGYFWITLAEAFVGQDSADAGPFDRIDAALAAGQALARKAGRAVFSMAEFDAQGRQLTPTATWSVEALEPPPSDDQGDESEATPAARDGEALDPLQALFSRPALAEDDAPRPSSRWARRKRQRARERANGSRRKR